MLPKTPPHRIPTLLLSFVVVYVLCLFKFCCAIPSSGHHTVTPLCLQPPGQEVLSPRSNPSVSCSCPRFGHLARWLRQSLPLRGFVRLLSLRGRLAFLHLLVSMF